MRWDSSAGRGVFMAVQIANMNVIALFHLNIMATRQVPNMEINTHVRDNTAIVASKLPIANELDM